VDQPRLERAVIDLLGLLGDRRQIRLVGPLGAEDDDREDLDVLVQELDSFTAI
jgi:hypothetical protein